jgi:predicted alpha/beta-fold hydrolase
LTTPKLTMTDWRAPWWLGGGGVVGGNLQTIWPARLSKHWPRQNLPFTGRLQRVDTPDGDFVDFDWLVEPHLPDTPVLIVFHGLEGSSSSHYAQAWAHWAWEQGWGCVVPHFRGCSGEPNRLPRAYHSGDFAEVGWMIDQVVAARPQAPCMAVGISLGGNALLRWAQEAGHSGASKVKAVAAVSSPLDLAAAGYAIGKGFNRRVYTRMFLDSMRPKMLAKLQQWPGFIDAKALLASRDLYEYDNAVTAPIHGFANTEDYWSRCSAGPRLKDLVGLPALVLNALNDPFLPPSALPRPDQVSKWVTLWQPPHGGHVGFPGGHWPGHVAPMPSAVGEWFKQHL